MTISDQYATIHSGIRIRDLEAGSSTSLPALTLIPAWRLPAFLRSEQLESFSKLTSVIALGRSQGELTKTNDGNTPESRAKDLHDLLSGLAIVCPVLVGWSQGAQGVAAFSWPA